MIAESARFRTNHADLPPTASYGQRSLTWTLDDVPEFGGTLKVRCGRKESRYVVHEIDGCEGGRGFEVYKVGEGTRYNALIADDGRHVCDCLGKESNASERAENRSGEVHETAGCKHIDALLALIERNWI